MRSISSRHRARFAAWLLAGLFAFDGQAATLRDAFANPPDDARPWVYWTWLSSNVTRESITADLEAMQRVGIGGALILDVDQGTPAGPVRFFDPQWQALFKHTVEEAKRLGLEINVNNGPGYYGSGGPWVRPEQGMQSVFQSETHVQGGAPWSGDLPAPIRRPDYHDIAVLAVPEPDIAPKDRYKIPDFTMKALLWKSWIAYKGTRSAPLTASAPSGAIIPRDKVVDLSSRMDPAGHLSWNVPPGEWTILRLGYAYNGSEIGPTPKGQGGPETDKLSRAATDFHFQTFVRHLDDLVGPENRRALVGTHIDSWEGGGQNWTPGMREEFQRRRGYDPLPYLPVLTGRVLGDLQVTERFLWDLRKTVSELMVANYAGEFQRLAHEEGLRFTFESYTTCGNDLDAACFADEPMAEFWTPNGQGLDFQPTLKSMSSAAHLNRRPVVGAEAFTSGSSEKWLWHPAMLKRLGDVAFVLGANRFVFHRYAAQRFVDRKPGLQMGPWGLHYERTNTWWDWSRPWHTYIARCQFLLRQGEFVADVLSLESEEPLLRFQEHPVQGYDYDACGDDTFAGVTVQDGQLVVPGGRRYRLLTLQHTGTMTVGQLTHIRDLVRAGAAVWGNPPQATPGLTDFPQADAGLKALADELWGDGATETDRRVGRGRVFHGISMEQALAQLGVPPDWSTDKGLLRHHRVVGDTDVYFVANPGGAAVDATCGFRVTGKSPELWDPETGRVTPLPAYSTATPGITRLSLSLGPSGSTFVVFRPSGGNEPRVESVTRDGQAIVQDGLRMAGAPPVDWAGGSVHEPGAYVFRSGDGQEHQITVPPLPAPLTMDGPWKLRFPGQAGAPPAVTMESLISWSVHPEPGVRYFSGAATYSNRFSLPAAAVGTGRRLLLDLGKVQVMAKVTLNGQDLGILWKPPYRVDVTMAARPGENALEIAVVNLWPNRLIGDEQMPEDSDRKPNGTLNVWPDWLLAGQPSPTGRLTFSSWRLWKKGDALQESGLLGPVTFQVEAALPR